MFNSYNTQFKYSFIFMKITPQRLASKQTITMHMNTSHIRCVLVCSINVSVWDLTSVMATIKPPKFN